MKSKAPVEFVEYSEYILPSIEMVETLRKDRVEQLDDMVGGNCHRTLRVAGGATKADGTDTTSEFEASVPLQSRGCFIAD